MTRQMRFCRSGAYLFLLLPTTCTALHCRRCGDAEVEIAVQGL